jgi:hypothetical protein
MAGSGQKIQMNTGYSALLTVYKTTGSLPVIGALPWPGGQAIPSSRRQALSPSKPGRISGAEDTGESNRLGATGTLSEVNA